MNSQIAVREGALNQEALMTLQSEGFDRMLLLEDADMALASEPLLTPLYQIISSEDRLCIKAGEEHKAFASLTQILDWLLERRATRYTILLIAGGGALLDMGGFAAAIYKRGIPTVYIPTTLLAMVDASIGGKTAIDYKGVKNLIGAFSLPHRVIVDPLFLRTLDSRELIAGYWELVKHALLSGKEAWYAILSFDPINRTAPWSDIIQTSIETKQVYVSTDLYDLGVRQYLNLGHTIGHALEAYSHKVATPNRPPLRHGEAVLIGLICELYIAHARTSFPIEPVRQLISLAKELQSPYLFSCKEYGTLIEYMYADKKNKGDKVTIIALEELGKPLRIEISEEEIKESFDFYREIFGQ